MIEILRINDLPPGTGDTLINFCTRNSNGWSNNSFIPQDLALVDVKRGIQMFEKTG